MYWSVCNGGVVESLLALLLLEPANLVDVDGVELGLALLLVGGQLVLLVRLH